MKKSMTSLRIGILLAFCLFAKASMATENVTADGRTFPGNEISDRNEISLPASADPDEELLYEKTTNNWISTPKICITPIILVPPLNVSGCLASITTLTVVALNATGYQWQVNMGSGWVDLVDDGNYSGVLTSTLSFLNVSTSINGYRYRVIVLGDCSLSATSNDVAVTLLAPFITANPSPSTICSGANTQFTIAATLATSYQWEVNQGSGYAAISNGGVYSGATTNTLTVTGVTAAMNAYTYRCVAIGLCSPSAYSLGALLTVNSAPAITLNPVAASVCNGLNTQFSVSASGANAYQWQVNQGSGYTNITDGGVYSGAATGTLTITSAAASMNGYAYRAVVSGPCSPSATSTGAALTINFPPAITQNPAPGAACDGLGTQFSVSATGANAYQWQVDQGSGYANITNGGTYSGATTSTLTIAGATGSMNGYNFRAIVSGICSPSATSAGAALTINYPPAVTQNPTASSICDGSNTVFTVVATGANAYQWQVDQGSGYANVTNGGVYSGANSSALIITGATASMSGYTYRSIVSGPCTPSDTSSAAGITVNSAPAITQNPAAATICTGDNAQFSVTASSASSYQWQVDQGTGYADITNGGVYSGATTATLTITGAASGMNGYSFRAVASGTCSPAATSAGAILTTNPFPAISQDPAAASFCDGSNAQFSVTASAVNAYQWQVNQGSGYANISDGAVYSGTTTNTLAINGLTMSMSGYSYRAIVSGGCPPSVTSAGAVLTVLSNVTYYQDADGDGYGNPAVTTTSCTGAPTGYVSNNTDTDDTNPTTNPGAPEICYDGIDNNSDGVIDENCTPLTTIQSIFDGVTLEYLNTQYVATNLVAGADQYEFRITSGSYSATATDNLMAGKVRIIQFAGYEYNKTYQMSVRARVNGIWAPFSTPVTISTTAYPHSEIQASQCGITLTETSTNIFTSTVNGATQYRFRFTNGASVQIVDRPVRSVTFNMLSTIAYGTTYTIDVAVQFNGVFHPYSTSCQVTTPPQPTQVRANQCGTTLPAVNKLIYAELLGYASGYRFRVTNGSSVQIIDRTTNSFYLTQLATYAYATTYSIDVAPLSNGVWLPYGPVCQVSTPVAGSVLTSLEPASCGVTVTNTSQALIATPVTNATQYEYVVSNAALGYSQTIVRTTSNFTLALLTGITLNTTYAVKIRTFVNGVWSAYGPSCNVTYASSARPMNDGALQEQETAGSARAAHFDAVTFPNPFQDEFVVSANSAASEMISIAVYDMAGKLMESHKVSSEKIGAIRLGSAYAAGIYQVQVARGTEVKNLKVVKE